jgi:ankyrin repeat protein
MSKIYATEDEELVRIHKEVEAGDLDSLLLRLERGEDIWRANNSGGTICHRAATFGRLEILQFVSSDPTRIELLQARGWYGFTVAHFAAMHGHENILAHLHSLGLPLDVTNNRGYSLAHELVASTQINTAKKIEVLNYLHSLHVPMDLPTKKGKTPRDLAKDVDDSEELLRFFDQCSC